MGATLNLDSHRRVKDLARELEKVSRALATYSLVVELAVARQDWLAAYDGAEVVETLTVRFTELRRQLLVLGVHRVIQGDYPFR